MERGESGVEYESLRWKTNIRIVLDEKKKIKELEGSNSGFPTSKIRSYINCISEFAILIRHPISIWLECGSLSQK